MTSEENKAVFQRFLDAENRGDLTTMSGLASPDIIDHGNGLSTHVGFNHVQSSYLQLRVDMPDLQYIIEDLLADGDKVICRWVLRGSNAATGERTILRGITIDRIVNGRIVEHWANYNHMNR